MPPQRMFLDVNTQKSLSLIDGFVPIFKFGTTNDIGIADPAREIWNRDHTLNYIDWDSPVPLYLTSDNNADTTKILIIAMDGKFEYKPYLVNLQGFTEVNISPNETFVRCNRIENINSIPTLGNVYISTGNTVNGVPPDVDVQAWLKIAEQQTKMTHMSIPGNYFAVFTRLISGILKDGNVTPTNADITIFTRVNDGIFLDKGTLPLGSEGGTFNMDLDTGRLLVPKTDIKFVCNSVGRNNTKVTVNYSLEMYRKDIIDRPIVYIPE